MRAPMAVASGLPCHDENNEDPRRAFNEALESLDEIFAEATNHQRGAMVTTMLHFAAQPLSSNPIPLSRCTRPSHAGGGRRSSTSQVMTNSSLPDAMGTDPLQDDDDDSESGSDDDEVPTNGSDGPRTSQVHGWSADQRGWAPRESLCSRISADIEMEELATIQEEYRETVNDLPGPRSTYQVFTAEEELNAEFAATQRDWWILHPSSRRRMIWDLIALTFVVGDSLMLPFQMSFVPNEPDGPLYFVSVAFFSMDLMLNCVTGYTDKGILIMEQKLVLRHYLRTWFPVDLLSTIPVHLIFSFDGDASSVRLLKAAKLMKLLRLMRLLRLLKLGRLLERVEVYFESANVFNVVNLLKVFIFVIVFCHWNACMWWAIGHPDSLFNSGSSTSEDSIAKNNEAADDEWQVPHWTLAVRTRVSGLTGEPEEFMWIYAPLREQYIFCVYWTLGVMRTMPSEVFPLTFSERTYTLVFMFLAFSIFAVCVAKITAILSKVGSRRAEFDERMAFIRKFWREKKAPTDLQSTTRIYLEHQLKRRRIMACEDVLKGSLSDFLMAEVHKVQFAETLKRAPFFGSMKDPLFKRALLCSNISSTVTVAPGDVVAYRNETSKIAVCVLQGELRLYGTRAEPQRRLDPGQWIDLEALLLGRCQGEPRPSSVVAEIVSELFCVHIGGFLDLRQKWPALDRHCQKQLRRPRYQHVGGEIGSVASLDSSISLDSGYAPAAQFMVVHGGGEDFVYESQYRNSIHSVQSLNGPVTSSSSSRFSFDFTGTSSRTSAGYRFENEENQMTFGKTKSMPAPKSQQLRDVSRPWSSIHLGGGGNGDYGYQSGANAIAIGAPIAIGG